MGRALTHGEGRGGSGQRAGGWAAFPEALDLVKPDNEELSKGGREEGIPGSGDCMNTGRRNLSGGAGISARLDENVTECRDEAFCHSNSQ